MNSKNLRINLIYYKTRLRESLSNRIKLNNNEIIYL